MKTNNKIEIFLNEKIQEFKSNFKELELTFGYNPIYKTYIFVLESDEIVNSEPILSFFSKIFDFVDNNSNEFDVILVDKNFSITPTDKIQIIKQITENDFLKSNRLFYEFNNNLLAIINETNFEKEPNLAIRNNELNSNRPNNTKPVIAMGETNFAMAA